MDDNKDIQNQDIVDENKKKKKNVIKYVLNISLVLVVTVVALIISLYGKFDNVVGILQTCDYRWILAIVGILIGCILVRSLVLFCFARLFTKKYHYHRSLAIDQVGQFYNAVTPGASGGQIMQAYTLNKQGLKMSSAISILAMYSIIYQAVLCIYGLISFIVKYDFINAIGVIPFNLAGWSFEIPVWPLTIIGFIVNISVILVIFLMAYWNGFHRFIMGPCITLLNKIKIIKNPAKSREDLRISVENFKIEFKRLLTNIPFTLLIAAFFFIYLTLKFSVPYFVGLALGNQSTTATLWDSVFLSNYHQMVTGLIPIPGSAGVSEYFFTKLFTNFYYINGVDSQTLCSTALLIWRSLTFTIPLIIAGITTAFYHTNNKRKCIPNEEFPGKNSQTFLDLSKETISLRLQEVEEAEKKSRLKKLNKKEKNK